MTHIQMQLSKPQNRWDLRAEANFPYKVTASVLRWHPQYDSLAAFGVRGWLVMKPTEICADKRDTRNSRPDWEETFLCYSWLWSTHWCLCSACLCLCRVQILVPPQELHTGTMQEASDISVLWRHVTKIWVTPCKRGSTMRTWSDALIKKYHMNKQQRWTFRSKTKNYTPISSDTVQTPYDIITPQRGK